MADARIGDAERTALAELALPRATTYYSPRSPGSMRLWEGKPQIEVTPVDPELGERLIRGLKRISGDVH